METLGYYDSLKAMQPKRMKFDFVVLFILSLLFPGCEDKVYEEYPILNPVYMSYEELRLAVAVEPPEELIKPGKIYLKDNYIFINEYFRGIHIIDNSNPEAPYNAGFINIPGNVDMAVVDNILFADSYIDLVAIDIADISDIKVTGRIEEIFPYMVPEVEKTMRIGSVNSSKGVVTGWKEELYRERIDNNIGICYPWYGDWGYHLSGGGSYGGSTAGSFAGQGGSMARFGVFENYLYAIDKKDMHVINIENFSGPVKTGTQSVASGIETMFIYGSTMFVGGQNGMYIYDLYNPEIPQQISIYQHITSCDPVVVEGDRAYVTLRGGTVCGGSLNRLDIIDISDLTNPEIIAFHSLKEPYGLGIDNNVLFICEGRNGMKVYDVSNPFQIKDKVYADFPDFHARDVIPVNGMLLMIGNDGLYQFDYSDLANIHLVSVIPVLSDI
ncbi:MAG: LVIVD repeat-containing protein [Bacteroidales bacterium]